MYGELKKDVRDILKKLCEMSEVQFVEGKVCRDHVHMYVAIPPKQSISEFMSYLKGKSTLMLFDRHPEYRKKWGDRHFWARGYYVCTVEMSTRKRSGNTSKGRKKTTNLRIVGSK